MAENTTSSDPTSAEFGDVDIAGMAEALGLSAEEKAIFSHNEGETAPTETGEVPAEGGEAVQGDGGTQEPAPTTEPEVKEAEGEGEGEIPDGVQRRIDKLTAEKYRAREEADTLKAQLADAQAKLAQQPVGTSPAVEAALGNVHSHAELAKAHENALQVKEWALMNPDGGSYTVAGKDGKPEEILLAPEDVRKLLVKSNRMLDRDIPARKAYLDEAAGHFAEAKKVYPQLFDQKNADAQLAGQFLHLAPWVRNFPDWPLVIGDYIRGFRARTAVAAGTKGTVASATTSAGNPARPKVVGSPKGQATPGNKVRAKSVSEVAQTRNDISIDEAAELIGNLF